MPRLPRYFVPDLPLHVIQRGNDRAPIFGEAVDYEFFRVCLAHAARRNRVAIHAYVLMTNHVHMLATPSSAASMPKTMQSVGRIFVQYFNTKYGRTGTRWEGRYKATIVHDDRYLLTCMRYIELNPVRAGIAGTPAEYRWSSFHANALGNVDALVDPHPIFRHLGVSAAERHAAYRELFDMSIREEEVRAIREATQKAWALGGEHFQRQVSDLSRRASPVKTGRPKRGSDSSFHAK